MAATVAVAVPVAVAPAVAVGLDRVGVTRATPVGNARVGVAATVGIAGTRPPPVVRVSSSLQLARKAAPANKRMNARIDFKGDLRP